MQVHANITRIRQEDCESLALAWERMKEAVRRCPNHGMEEWFIHYKKYARLWQNIITVTKLVIDI